MFTHHPKPPHHPHPHHAHPPYHGEMNRWHPPLPAAIDEELLAVILDDKDLARSVYRILMSCPPEVSATACIGLRLGGQIKELRGEIAELKSIISNNMQVTRVDNNAS